MEIHLLKFWPQQLTTKKMSVLRRRVVTTAHVVMEPDGDDTLTVFREAVDLACSEPWCVASFSFLKSRWEVEARAFSARKYNAAPGHSVRVDAITNGRGVHARALPRNLAVKFFAPNTPHMRIALERFGESPTVTKLEPELESFRKLSVPVSNKMAIWSQRVRDYELERGEWGTREARLEELLNNAYAELGRETFRCMNETMTTDDSEYFDAAVVAGMLAEQGIMVSEEVRPTSMQVGLDVVVQDTADVQQQGGHVISNFANNHPLDAMGSRTFRSNFKNWTLQHAEALVAAHAKYEKRFVQNVPESVTCSLPYTPVHHDFDTKPFENALHMRDHKLGPRPRDVANITITDCELALRQFPAVGDKNKCCWCNIALRDCYVSSWEQRNEEYSKKYRYHALCAELVYRRLMLG